MRLKATVAAVLIAAVLPAAAFAAAAKKPPIDPNKIPPTPAEVSVLADSGDVEFVSDFGHAFYTYDKDQKDRSACVDSCTEVWAPVRAGEKATPMGDWTLLNRGNGYMQWVYKGKPIYMNVPQVVQDTDPELNNDGHWHVLKP